MDFLSRGMSLIKSFWRNSPDCNNNVNLAEDSDLEFCIDTHSESSLSGWLWRPEHGDIPVTFEILMDGAAVAEVIADIYREDLKLARKGNGAHAFNIPVPPPFKNGWLHRLSLRVKGAEECFYLSPERRYAEIASCLQRCDFDKVEGTAYNSWQPTLLVLVCVDVNGLTAFTEEVTENGAFSFNVSAYLDTQNLTPSNNVLCLRVRINDMILTEKKYAVVSFPDNRHAVIFERLRSDCIRAKLIYLSSEESGKTLNINYGPLCKFAALPAAHSLFQMPEILSDDAPDAISFCLEGTSLSVLDLYIQYSCTLQNTETGITGSVINHDAPLDPVGLEILFDGKAVASTIADKYNPSTQRMEFFIMPGDEWMDGHRHTITVRPFGYQHALEDAECIIKYPSNQSPVNLQIKRVNGGIDGYILNDTRKFPAPVIKISQHGKDLGSVTATTFSKRLLSETVTHSHNGFRFKSNKMTPDEIQVQIETYGQKITADVPLNSQYAEDNLTGVCVILTAHADPLFENEEARILLNFARNRFPDKSITVALSSANHSMMQQKDLISHLHFILGKSLSETYDVRNFKCIPPSAISSNLSGGSLTAYEADLWVRTCRFSNVIAGTYGGPLSFMTDASRQGLLKDVKLTAVATGYAINSRWANYLLSDDYSHLESDVLERKAIEGCDEYAVPSQWHLSNLAELGYESIPVVICPESFRVAFFEEMPVNLYEKKTIVFIGICDAASGFDIFCSMIDRLSGPLAETDFDVIVAGYSSPFANERNRTIQNILKRMQRWPVKSELLLDRGWSSLCETTAALSENTLCFISPALEGTLYHSLCEAARAEVCRLLDLPCRPDNPSALAGYFQNWLNGIPIYLKPEHRKGTGSTTVMTNKTCRQTSCCVAGELPVVSICIIHHNRPVFLGKVLEAFEKNAYPNKEYIVVDDGSSVHNIDSELKVFSDWLKSRKGKLIRQNNSYLGSARNKAAQNASGELLLFFDDDNIPGPFMLEKLVHTYLLTQSDIVTSRYFLFDSITDIDPVTSVPKKVVAPFGKSLACSIIHNRFGDAAMLIKPDIFHALGGYTEDYGRGHEDWEMYTRAAMAGYSLEVHGEPLYWYRVTADSMSHAQKNISVDLTRNIRGVKGNVEVDIYRLMQFCQGQYYKDYLRK